MTFRKLGLRTVIGSADDVGGNLPPTGVAT